MQKQGLLIVVSGPSGTGKGTVCKELLKNHQEISYSVSATTRAPREGEVDGVNYYFHDKKSFEDMIEKGELLEWAQVYGNYYGTPLKPIREQLAAGNDILLEIDTQGAMNVKEKFPEGIYIYILPPSLSELERRIRGRGSETEESLAGRLGAACAELEIGRQYSYVVVNEDVSAAAEDIASILRSEHCSINRNQYRIDELLNEKEK